TTVAVDKEVVLPQQNYRPDNRSTCLQNLSQLESTLCQSLREPSTSFDVRGIQDQRIEPHVVQADNVQFPLPSGQRVKQGLVSSIVPYAPQICFQFPPNLNVDEIMDVVRIFKHSIFDAVKPAHCRQVLGRRSDDHDIAATPREEQSVMTCRISNYTRHALKTRSSRRKIRASTQLGTVSVLSARN